MNWWPLNLLGSPVFFLHLSVLVSSALSTIDEVAAISPVTVNQDLVQSQMNKYVWIGSFNAHLPNHPLLSRTYNSYLTPWLNDPHPRYHAVLLILCTNYMCVTMILWPSFKLYDYGLKIRGSLSPSILNHVWYILYSRKYWRELILVVGPKMAIAKILACRFKFGGSVRDHHTYNMQL